MANGLIDFGITRPNAAMETYQQGQQNQLAQMQMAQAQQAVQDAEAERQAYKGAANFGEVSQRLMQQGLGKQALAVSAAQAKQQAERIALQKDKLTLMKSYASRAMADPANAESYLTEYAKHSGSDVTTELERLRANGGDLEKNRMWAAALAVDADKLLPKFQEFSTPGGGKQLGSVDPLTAKFTATTTMAPQMTPSDKISAGQLKVAQDREARLAAGGSELKPLTELQTIKLRENVSKDYKSATNTLSQMDDLLDSIDAVKTAPGLSAATGYTGKYVPSFSEGKAAQAETRLANLRGKVTALGKATASMSGSIGAIANQEWKILADQIAAIDEVKGKGPLLEQIALVEQQALGARDRVRDIYEKTRSEDFERFPQFRNLPASRERGKPPAPAAAAQTPSVVRVPANAITNPQFPGFSITPGTP